jgi:hypothetical protein
MTDLKNISTTCGCSKYGESTVAAIDRGPGCCAERDEAAIGTDDLGCCGQDCCGAEDDAEGEAGRSEIDVSAPERNLDIEFLYLDLSVCERCQGTEVGLEDALVEVSRVLELSGVSATVRKTHVQTEEQARALGFVSSPTIRINGQDIQVDRGNPMDVKESPCGCGSALCGEEIDCRDWVYRGDEFETSPVGLIVAAILREAFAPEEAAAEPSPASEVPENLKKFFAAKRESEKPAEATEDCGDDDPLPCYPESPACRFP